MSDSTTAKTWAGAQWRAKRPPLTVERCLRMVFISVISAPQARSCLVMSCSSSVEMMGFSNRAEPPPDSRNRTRSSGLRSWVSSRARLVAAKVSSSGTGWPASQTSRFPMGPSLWPCLVMTMPPSGLRSRLSQAAWAMDQAALPTATRMSFPEPNSFPARARATAASGRTWAMASRTMVLQSFLSRIVAASQNKFILPVPPAGQSGAGPGSSPPLPGCQLPCRCGCTAKNQSDNKSLGSGRIPPARRATGLAGSGRR